MTNAGLQFELASNQLLHEHVKQTYLCSFGAHAPLMEVLSRKSFAKVGLLTALLHNELL
jgi:hypothetical protein